jgi:hypothetical protein
MDKVQKHNSFNTLNYVLLLMWETKFHTHTKQVKLQFCMNSDFLIGDRNATDFKLNGSKHSSNLIYSLFLH